MLVGNGMMCVAITQLIFERAAAILYHVDYFLFGKKLKHSENACFQVQGTVGEKYPSTHSGKRLCLDDGHQQDCP